MTYDARRHHVGTRLTVGTWDVMVVHRAEGSVWNLGLEVDAFVWRARVLVGSKLFRHPRKSVGCSVDEVGRCWLSREVGCLVVRCVCVTAVGSCGVVVDEDVVDARGSRTASRIVVHLGAKWGGRRGGIHRQNFVTLAAVHTLVVLTVG